MKVELTELKIQNFRNIENAVYVFGSRSAICGQNRIGKSNTLEAINYLLTDTLLIDCNNLQSIKPLHDTKLEVMVEGSFENSEGEKMTLKKLYREQWVKTRGTDLKEFKGHETKLYINGTEYSTAKDYYSRVNEFFALDSKIKSKVDVTRMLTNPYYLTNEIDWKILRGLIIELVGDVTNDDVIKTHSEYLAIENDLTRAGGKVEYAIKSANQQVSTMNERITMAKAVIDDLRRKEDVDPVVLHEAELKIETLNNQILNLQNGKPQNVTADSLRNEIAELKLKLSESINKDRLNLDLANEEINSKLKNLQDKREEQLARYRNLQMAMNTKSIEINNLINALKFLPEEKRTKLKRKEELYAEWDKVDSATYNPEHSDTCPNCGYVLNQAQIEDAKIHFESHKNEELLRIENEGKKLNVEIEHIDLQIKETDMSRDKAIAELKELQSNSELCVEEGKKIADELEKTKQSLRALEDSKETLDLRKLIARKEDELDQAIIDYNSSISDTDSAIYNLRQEIKENQLVIDKHKYYLMALEDAKKKSVELEQLEWELSGAETKQILLKDFIKTKLSMLDSNVSKVFPTVKFRLIKENIKVGSWDEVCEPKIIGKDTLFVNGSTSEKIITGIAIIESIKAATGLPNLPILFDEGEALDSNTILNLETTSQIICAKVDEVFTVPTVRELR